MQLLICMEDMANMCGSGFFLRRSGGPHDGPLIVDVVQSHDSNFMLKQCVPVATVSLLRENRMALPVRIRVAGGRESKRRKRCMQDD